VSEGRPFHPRGAGSGRAGRFGTVAVVAVLAVGGMPVPAAPLRAARPVRPTIDAVVAKLRDLPLPIRPFPHGIGSNRAVPPPLPALELRRQRVYDELHALGPGSVPALARALRDPDPQMRRNVAVALDVVGGGWWHFADGGSKLDLRPALPALLAALRDSDPGVRAWAAQDISDMGAAAAAAVPRLSAMLRRPDAESRRSACRALGEIGSAARGALPDLQRALADPSPEVRAAARSAIVKIGRAEALRSARVD
jgi:HEAT repeat protein